MTAKNKDLAARELNLVRIIHALRDKTATDFGAVEGLNQHLDCLTEFLSRNHS
jgi:hypothetical protein